MGAVASVLRDVPSMAELAPPAPGAYATILGYFQYFPLVRSLQF